MSKKSRFNETEIDITRLLCNKHKNNKILKQKGKQPLPLKRKEYKHLDHDGTLHRSIEKLEKAEFLIKEPDGRGTNLWLNEEKYDEAINEIEQHEKGLGEEGERIEKRRSEVKIDLENLKQFIIFGMLVIFTFSIIYFGSPFMTGMVAKSEIIYIKINITQEQTNFSINCSFVNKTGVFDVHYINEENITVHKEILRCK